MDIIVGTAGHIDHGKTQLVKALTGTDTDRLPEEKSRGITIDLGFAELAIDDLHFGFVDVPGHERFVKNMLAGASGIDLVLLVVAADEGIMPQTCEHFDICRLLEIGSGVIAITKSDLADADLIDLIRLEIDELVKGSFLEKAPVVAISSKTGAGLDTLKAELVSTAQRVKQRSEDLIARLAIDRSFAVKGFGTVVTGTLASGTIAEGDELDLLPTGRTVRVRGVQSHGAKLQRSVAGRRTAVNLAGIDYADVARGMLLAEKGVLQPSQMFDVSVEVLPDSPRPLRTRQRVRLHIGTAEVLARVSVINELGEIPPGESGFVQLRLESPIAAVLSERFILRSYSPQMTIAGGLILGPAGDKIRKRNAAAHAAFLRGLADAIGDNVSIVALLIEHTGQLGIDRSGIRSITGLRSSVLEDAVKKLVADSAVFDSDGVLLSKKSIDTLTSVALDEITQFQAKETLARGMPLDRLRESIFRFLRPEIERAVLKRLTEAKKVSVEQDVVRLAGHAAELSPAESQALAHLRQTYMGAGLEVPKLDEALEQAAKSSRLDQRRARQLFQKLIDGREVTQITTEFYFSTAVIDSLIARLKEHAGASPDRMIDVAQFKQIAGVSRKFAIPLLEYFDQQRITARRGDKRIII